MEADAGRATTETVPRRRRRSPWSRRNLVVLAMGALAGLVAAVATAGAPTGTPWLDAVYRFVFVAGTTIASAHARRWSWIVLAAAPAVFAGFTSSPATGVALCIPLLVAIGAAAFDVRRRWLGALVGAGSTLALLQLGGIGPHGVPTLAAAVGVVAVLASARAQQRRPTRRLIDRIALGVAAGVGIVVVLFGVATLLGAQRAADGLDAARAGLAAARTGDDAATTERLDSSAASFRAARDAFGSPLTWPARVVPLLAHQARAAEDVSGIGLDLAGVAGDASRRANYRSLEVTDGQVDIARVEALAQPLEDVRVALERADHDAAAIATDWLVPPLAGRVEGLRQDLAEAHDETTTAQLAVAVAPDLLGRNGPRRYLVVFTTPAESRGTGGLIGNYALLTADGGRLELTRNGRASDLAPKAGDPPRTLDAPADYLRRYGPDQPEVEVRDATLSPDFPSVGQALASIYPQTRGGEPIDGVVAADPYAIAAMLRITGGVDVAGLDVRLDADNAPDLLLRRQYVEFADANAERIDMLDAAATATFDRFIHARALRPNALARAFSQPVAEGRLLAWSPDPQVQRLYERLGLDGAFPRPDGNDLFALVTQNGGNNKIDVFLHRGIDYRATVDEATGRLDADVTVTLWNDAPATGLPAYVIGNRPSSGQPPGTNWLWLNLYSPHTLVEATIDGQPADLGMQPEFGLSVYQRYLAVPAGTTVTIRLHLVGTVTPGQPYRLVLPTQPLVNPDEVTTSVVAR